MEKELLESVDSKLMSGGIIDKTILTGLIDDVGMDNAEAVLGAFLEELDKQAGILVAAGHGKNLEQVAEAAHRLKSTTASLGATAVNKVVITLEQAAKTNQVEVVDQTIGEFQTLADKTVKAMAVILKSLLE